VAKTKIKLPRTLPPIDDVGSGGDQPPGGSGTTTTITTTTTEGREASDSGLAGRIAGLSVLKGLVVYGATLAFAGLYAYFMEEIASAASNTPPHLSPAMVGAAAALAGILGSAFALVIGVPVRTTNLALEKAQSEDTPPRGTLLRRVLSLEPGGTDQPSWPQTFGIWMYAGVAAAVALVYILNQSETPPGIRALAIGFAGYVVALMTAAYGVGTGRGR
jgi:hypothetical protein